LLINSTAANVTLDTVKMQSVTKKGKKKSGKEMKKQGKKIIFDAEEETAQYLHGIIRHGDRREMERGRF